MKKNHITLYDMLVELDELRDEGLQIAQDLNHLSFSMNDLVKRAKESAHYNLANMEHYLCASQTAEDIKKLKSLITKKEKDDQSDPW